MSFTVLKVTKRHKYETGQQFDSLYYIIIGMADNQEVDVDSVIERLLEGR